MFQWLFDLFTPVLPSRKPKFTRPKAVEFSTSSSSFVYRKGGKVVYEERNGKVITGTPSDKAEGEKIVSDGIDSANKVIDSTQKNLDDLFRDLKKSFFEKS